MTDYTRKDIRTIVASRMRDSSHTAHSQATKNRVISATHRDFVLRTRCNRNVLIFSLADGTSNGALEYDRKQGEHLLPTVTRVDVENQNHYKISNCDRLDKMARWIGTTSDDNGYFKELRPLSQKEIDRYNLTTYTNNYPIGYQMLDVPDTFRLLPQLSSDAYTMKIEVRYRESVRDLITFNDSPTDSTVVRTTGNGLSDFTATVTSASIPARYRITVLTAASPDTVKTEKNNYDENGWVEVTASEELTGSAQAIADGVTYTAAATTGHTAGDVFEFAVDDLLPLSVPAQYRHILEKGVMADLYVVERDSLAQKYIAEYEAGIQEVRRIIARDTTGRATPMRVEYQGAGG